MCLWHLSSSPLFSYHPLRCSALKGVIYKLLFMASASLTSCFLRLHLQYMYTCLAFALGKALFSALACAVVVYMCSSCTCPAFARGKVSRPVCARARLLLCEVLSLVRPGACPIASRRPACLPLLYWCMALVVYTGITDRHASLPWQCLLCFQERWDCVFPLALCLRLLL